MKVVLAGGSGSLGRRIADDLAARGDEVVVLTRRVRADLPHRQVPWDGRTVGEWRHELAGAALVNLAGELVDRRPTPANVRLLTESRTLPTRALAEAAAGLPDPPSAWLQLSTLAIYGDAGEQVLDESATPAAGPPQMAGVATAWEEAAATAPAGVRRVVLRTGVVLDRGTPALDRLAGVVRWGLGGRIADGRQWVSWLHVADFLAVVRLCLDDPSLAGVVHATAPEPIRNADMMAELRRVLHRPRWAPPTPAWAVRVGSIALRTDPALALTGRRCVPARLLASGFRFRHPAFGPAIEDLLGRRPS
jgi:uncharacterized protein (TIGR01777 family)